MSEEINRYVIFGTAPIFDPEDKTGVNNRWIYRRAFEGYLFLLSHIEVSVSSQGPYREGLIALYDGHEYTHWNQFPGVESRELLTRAEFNQFQYNSHAPLHNWKCKEFTLGLRSTSTENNFRMCAIVWFYLKKATREELLEYALKHPIREDTFKRVMRGTTVDPHEVE